ncbi:hypothetical protein BGZ76_010754 [Entomortierella beljakovae]|nr:hypothetical protein BGZ76_010754 [Entomortierella beljakovae]
MRHISTKMAEEKKNDQIISDADAINAPSTSASTTRVHAAKHRGLKTGTRSTFCRETVHLNNMSEPDEEPEEKPKGFLESMGIDFGLLKSDEDHHDRSREMPEETGNATYY